MLRFARAPKYPVTLEIQTSEEKYKIGEVKSKVKAALVLREGDRVAHRLALTQEDISNLISVLRTAQQRMEPVSTRVPLDTKEKLVAKAEEFEQTPSEYLRDLIEREVS